MAAISSSAAAEAAGRFGRSAGPGEAPRASSAKRARFRSSRRSALEVLLGNGLARRYVEAAVVDRAAPGRRPLVLNEKHEPAGRRRQRRLPVRVRVEEHRARAVRTLADLELAFQDVPDLREVVLVQRMVRAGLIAHEAGIGLGRALGTGMEEHLAPLPWPAQRLPRPVVDVDGFHWLMIGCRGSMAAREKSMIVAPEA